MIKIRIYFLIVFLVLISMFLITNKSVIVKIENASLTSKINYKLKLDGVEIVDTAIQFVDISAPEFSFKTHVGIHNLDVKLVKENKTILDTTHKILILKKQKLSVFYKDYFEIGDSSSFDYFCSVLWGYY